MSLETIDKIPRATGEMRDALKGLHMPFEVALEIDAALVDIAAQAALVKAERDEDIRELVSIVEGLLANWPHSEIAPYYLPKADRAVLMRDEALRRAARFLEEAV